jgi:hypothetical protein
MIKTNYFDGTGYTAADDVAPWASLLTGGVFDISSGAFQTNAHSPANLSVDVQPGAAIKNGYYIKSDAVENVPIIANTSGYNRIDIIVLDVDEINKVTTIKTVQGTPSSSPTAPLPASNQLKIAEVSVGNNVSVINTGNITDKRVNVDILGSSLAGKIDKNESAIFSVSGGTLTLLNGWTDSSSNPRFYKDSLGIIHCRGRISGGTMTAGTILFNSPVGYRPTSTIYMYGVTYASGTDQAVQLLQMDANGNLSLTYASKTIVVFDFSFKPGY